MSTEARHYFNIPRRFEMQGDNVPQMAASSNVESATVVSAETPEEKRTSRAKKVVPLAVLGAMIFLTLLLFRLEAGSAVYRPVPVTTFPGHESAPYLSPDGKQVAFSWAGPERENVDIYVRLIGAESILRLTDAPERDFVPTWSPDGARIAFQRMEEGGCAIYVVPALGGAERRLASCGANIYGDLAWSPDGQWLAFNDKSSPREAFSIHLLSPATLERRSITTPPAHFWGDYDPAFSPDGSHISFTRSVSEGMQDLYVVSVEGGDPLRITNDSRNLNGSAWTRDGRHLVFSSKRTGFSGLWRVSAEGGIPERIGIGDTQAFFPNIAGKRLVYLQVIGQTNIWQYDPDQPEDASPLIVPEHGMPAMDPALALSPDGEGILTGQTERLESDIMLIERFE